MRIELDAIAGGAGHEEFINSAISLATGDVGAGAEEGERRFRRYNLDASG
jgi:hypothetical protein